MTFYSDLSKEERRQLAHQNALDRKAKGRKARKECPNCEERGIKLLAYPAQDRAVGTWRVGTIPGKRWRDIARVLGPNNSGPSGDGKVRYEWIVEYGGEVFTVYDYRTPGAKSNPISWSVGGRTDPTAFIMALGLGGGLDPGAAASIQREKQIYSG